MREGTKVSWTWGANTAHGVVRKTYERTVTRKLKGTEVKRKGSKDDPALYIEQEDGDGVLKLASEVERA
jgi:hypothetical protein